MHFFFKLDSQHSENSSCRGKISAQPHTTLCIQFLDRENNDKNNTLLLGKHIFYNSMGLCGSFTTEIFSKYFSRLAQKVLKFFTASHVPVRMSGQAFMVISPRIAANFCLYLQAFSVNYNL